MREAISNEFVIHLFNKIKVKVFLVVMPCCVAVTASQPRKPKLESSPLRKLRSTYCNTT